MKVEEKVKGISSSLASLLRQAREDQGLSANKLAELSGLNRQMVTFVERGERGPSVETFCRLSFALGLSPSDLLQAAEASVHKA